ncbi:MAG: addiction module protein [Betaproteobacteria bacterium CG2_30_59_46]|nr:MAG: addiction module protein [Betaproteobacteria bacterium CG2_30_59_46]PIY01181.1 MAG: addiction module protein [Hydrogenophilales bacterium CG_4_10_14_3_um_filter_58_23]PJB03547.1 MAG: addiction module protein [Hydrogenophilales bacterium CG_4_9_14_3_um_filter_59_35]
MKPNQTASQALLLLPDIGDIETKPVLKKLARAHQALAELKGVVASIPNQSILISTLSLQEAKDSSAIENIITTHDELYRSDSVARRFVTVAAKEVHNYATALRNGFEQVKRTGLLTNNDILEVQACIEESRAGFRKLPGTALKNDLTGATIYTPPQHPDEIIALMTNLERFINEDELCDWDPLTKMAVIHHQFESIHPFYDGNGRTGRIINILYLVQHGLLGSPVLYLSRYINQNKADYYRLLQTTRDTGNWEGWLLYMLDGVEQTAHQTTALVVDIKALMQRCKHRLRTELPKIYSQDLINNLFRHPYTKIEFLAAELQVVRQTAARYLDEVAALGLLTKHKLGKDNYYLNDALYQRLHNVSENTEAQL